MAAMSTLLSDSFIKPFLLKKRFIKKKLPFEEREEKENRLAGKVDVTFIVQGLLLDNVFHSPFSLFRKIAVSEYLLASRFTIGAMMTLKKLSQTPSIKGIPKRESRSKLPVS